MSNDQNIIPPPHMQDRLYRVISVDKSDAPNGTQDGNWYHYVIGEGQSRIDGYRCGTCKSVTEHAESFAKNLNERAAKGYSAYAAKKVK